MSDVAAVATETSRESPISGNIVTTIGDPKGPRKPPTYKGQVRTGAFGPSHSWQDPLIMFGVLRSDTPGASPRGQLRQLALVLQAFLHLLTRQEWQQFVVVALDPVRAVTDGPLVALAGDDL